MATLVAIPLSRNRAQVGLRCEVITEFSRLESLAPDWERLFESVTPAGGMFQSWAWARAFWSVHGEHLSLCTPVVFEGTTVIGILPVAVRGRTARLLGDPYADYNGLLCAPERAAQVVPLAFAALLDAPVGWTQCVFEGVRAGSPLLKDGPALPAWLRLRRQVSFGYSCPATVDDGAVLRRFSRKHALVNKENRLKRLGRVSMRHLEDRNEILTRHLDGFVEMLVSRQALMGLRSPFLSADARAMLRALVTRLNPARELRFSVLELDGRPLAYHLGFQHAGKLALYMTTFDVDFWNESPGAVLLRKAFEWAHEERLTELDFSIGDEEYKKRYANQTRETFTVHFDRHPRSPRTGLRRLVRRHRETIRRNPEKVSRVRRARATLTDATRRMKHPVGLLRAACGGYWPGASSAEHIFVCRPLHIASRAPAAQVRRLTLKDLGLLRLQHASIDNDAVEACRLAVVQGEALYLVSVDSFHYLFRVAFVGDRAPGERRDATREVAAIREVAVFDGSPLRKLAVAFAALLCTVEPGPEVRIRSRHPGAVRRAMRLAGYEASVEESTETSVAEATGGAVTTPVTDAAE